MYRHYPTHSALIEHLLSSKLLHQNSPAANAFSQTDRAKYVLPASKPEAYDDSPLPIGYGATISAPHMHATCAELASELLCKPNSSALDVGVGSGFLAAIFKRMGCSKVIGIDYVPELVEMAKRNCQADGVDVDLRTGDGWEGVPGEKFDVIHVGAAASEVPHQLLVQLKSPGLLIVPVGVGSQVLKCIEKDEDGVLSTRDLLDVRYVPLVRQSS